MHMHVQAVPGMGRRKRIYLAGALLGAGPMSLVWLLVILGALPPTPTDRISAAVVLVALFTPFAALWDDPGERRTRVERLAEFTYCWFLLAGAAQTLWDLPWFLMDLAGTFRHIGPGDHWLWPWWSYASTDTRYLISDPTVAAVECCAGFAGPFMLLAAYLSRRGSRAAASWLTLILGVGVAWGQVIFILAEVRTGFAHLQGGAFGFWIKWLGLNLPWLLSPALYIPGSIGQLREIYEARGAARAATR